MRASSVGLAFVALAASCAHPQTALRPEKSVAPTPSAMPSASKSAALDYTATFDSLFARIDRLHVFAAAVKPLWPEREAQLRAEARTVSTREEALVVLAHVQAALGDRHCYLTPPSDLRPKGLSLGVSLFAERSGGEPRVRIDEVLDSTLHDVAEGDEVVAIDGVPLKDWLAAHPFESNSLNSEVALSDQVQAIVTARLPFTRVREGDARRLVVRRGGVERTVELHFAPPSRWESHDEESLDDAPPMSSVLCRSDKRPLYDGFELAGVGQNVCVYRPTTGDRSTRLVRYVSFAYGQGSSDDQLRAAKADHDFLLRELKGAKAVVLDVHENHGGNNPFVFLSWFANRPWDHQQVHVRVAPELSEDEVRQVMFGDTTLTRRYVEAQKAGATELAYPFLCVENKTKVLSGTCDARGPRPTEQVTTAPVAIVTGPECVSSCDSLTADWAAFSLGPVVGRQPAHGFTTTRYAFSVMGPDGRDLGLFRLALSWEAFPRSRTPLEGSAVKLDVTLPSTFESRHTWVRDAVAEARRRLEKR